MNNLYDAVLILLGIITAGLILYYVPFGILWILIVLFYIGLGEII